MNQAKSKGLWLGGWCGRSDPPVALEWSSSKIKVLGIFVGVGDLDSNNWRPHIETVDHVLKSWRSHSLSFHGKALVINALALSRVWYVASLIHMPSWVAKELSSLAFSIFWSGKHELVSRSVVIQSPLFGGFSVVSVQYEVWALLGQWVKRLASSSAGWSSLISFGLWRPLVVCLPSSFPGRFLLTPGFCHLFIPLSFWPGEASMVPSPRLATRLFSVRPVLMSAALWLICPQRAVICTFFPRTWFHRIMLISFPRCTVHSTGHSHGVC